MNVRLLDMLSKVKAVGCDTMMTYAAMARRGCKTAQELELQVKMNAADQVAHSIAGEVMRGGDWSRTDEPDGAVFRLRGYWMSRRQMIDLLQQAYDLGRMDERSRDVVVEVAE